MAGPLAEPLVPLLVVSNAQTMPVVAPLEETAGDAPGMPNMGLPWSAGKEESPPVASVDCFRTAPIATTASVPSQKAGVERRPQMMDGGPAVSQHLLNR